MSDPDQPGEALDEELLDGELLDGALPPDRPLGEDRGTTGLEQLGGESFEERDEETEPEVWERRPGDARAGEQLVVEDGAPLTGEGEDSPVPVAKEPQTGSLAPDDDFTGDETTRDVVPEREPDPAEETAMHSETEDRRVD